jgi:hypothetical protein
VSSERKLKVLYVAGNGRSGSTLIDVILGQVPGFFPVGEARDVWDYGLIENRSCGCGVPFRECPAWSEIFRDELLAESALDPARIVAWRERFAQTKRLAPILLRGAGYTRHPNNGIRDYMDALERLYRSISQVTGADVIVDSSKWPTYAFLLDNLESIDLYVLHLVRDPRACAYSWRRTRESEPGVFLDVQGPVYSTSFWVVWNPAIRHLFADREGRYMLLRYEDFAARPRESIHEVLRFVGADAATSPFVSDDTVAIATTHTIEGNATRFARGRIVIRPDLEWQATMPWRSRAVVTAMTWPLLWRYGYLGDR